MIKQPKIHRGRTKDILRQDNKIKKYKSGTDRINTNEKKVRSMPPLIKHNDNNSIITPVDLNNQFNVINSTRNYDYNK